MISRLLWSITGKIPSALGGLSGLKVPTATGNVSINAATSSDLTMSAGATTEKKWYCFPLEDLHQSNN